MNWKKIYKLTTFFEVLLACVPIFIYICIFNTLPDKIPVHFSSAGTPDGFAGKLSVEIVFIICIGLIGFFVGTVISRFINKRMLQGVVAQPLFVSLITAHGLPIFMVVFFDMLSVYFLMAITRNFAVSGWFITRMAFFSSYILLFFIGLTFPHITPNRVFGIRTAKTLDSKVMWVRVHKKCGIATCVLSAVAILFGILLFIPDTIVVIISGAILVAIIVLYCIVLNTCNG